MYQGDGTLYSLENSVTSSHFVYVFNHVQGELFKADAMEEKGERARMVCCSSPIACRVNMTVFLTNQSFILFSQYWCVVEVLYSRLWSIAFFVVLHLVTFFLFIVVADL